MPKLVYRAPSLTSTNMAILADPEDINSRNEDIARLVNGGLGVDNLRPGWRIPTTKMKCHRSVGVMKIELQSRSGVHPLFVAPVAMRILSVGATTWTYTSAFNGFLLVSGKTIAEIGFDPAQTNGPSLCQTIAEPDLSVGDVVELDGGSLASLRSIVIAYSVEHEQ